MPRSSRIAAAITAISLTAPGACVATPQEVIDDYFNPDGKLAIDHPHSPADLREAISRAKLTLNDGDARQFAAAVNQLIAQQVAGRKPDNGAPDPLTPLPDSAPFWVTLAGIGAGLLALGGAGSAIWRRSRPRH